MSRYRKVEVQMWGDNRFRMLTAIPECGQGLWIYLMTGPHTGPIPGLFRVGRGALADELGWSLKGFDKAFKEILDLGMAEADFSAKVVWLPNAIKHNKPESPNVIRAWGKYFELIPECELKWKAYASLKGFVVGLSEGFHKAFNDTLPDPFSKARGHTHRVAKPYQEQEQKKYLSQGQVSGFHRPQRLADDPEAVGLSQDSAGEPATANGHALGWDDDAPFGGDRP